MGSGAGFVVVAGFVVYLLLAVPFVLLVASRTSVTTGWLMSVPLVFLPFTLLIAFMTP
ncbi:hypothetical protein [Streptomyces phaeofaciens]|uniref:hypothetical protein n=1 Tax=Streptomyces phaeofaciens TaxID=68254 RepID=UPI0036A7AF0E